jgi:diphosphomevalonate decarboxylase
MRKDYPMMNGAVAWQSPSNIAIIKYWGKHGRQLPKNASLSLTLSSSHSETKMHFTPGTGRVDFYFENKKVPAFEARVARYFKSLSDGMVFIGQYDYVIHSSNSFPHSAGIASSASAMSALALCLCSMEEIITAKQKKNFIRHASGLARLGSGSACRSLYPIASVWGEHKDIPGSSDQYGIPFAERISPVFAEYGDAILIANKGKKSVSSSVGHKLMNNHPFATQRFIQANQNMQRLLLAMKEKNLEDFGLILEQEALSLHAMMMTSQPPYLLLEPNTIRMLNIIREFRENSGIPAFFTLDAGPNIHLLYPGEYRKEILSLIETQLLQYCENAYWIDDRIGQGPRKIEADV